MAAGLFRDWVGLITRLETNSIGDESCRRSFFALASDGPRLRSGVVLSHFELIL
jgi:hypothetical protein